MDGYEMMAHLRESHHSMMSPDMMASAYNLVGFEKQRVQGQWRYEIDCTALC